MPRHSGKRFCEIHFSAGEDKIPMNPTFSGRHILNSLVACFTVVSLCAVSALTAYAQDAPSVALTQISSDPFTVGPGQHATQVEPHMLANDSTLVSAFQTGRIVNGGGTAIGWATSTDGGSTWAHGFLPGLTVGNSRGPFHRATYPTQRFYPHPRLFFLPSLPISHSHPTPA